MNRKFLSTTAGAATAVLIEAVVLCSGVHAQSWTPDRQYTEGAGIKLGDFELHPGVAVRGGYDTNVFKADGDAGAGSGGQEVVGAAMLTVTPHINISTQGKQRAIEGESAAAPYSPPKLALRAGLAATYFHYFEDAAPRNLEVDTDVWLGIMPERPVNLEIATSYQRTIRPFTQDTGTNGNNTYAKNDLRPSARLNFGSRSQVLTAFVGYAPELNLYESNTFEYLSAIDHRLVVGSVWKFLPHTALIYDGSLGRNNYLDDSPSGPVSVLVSDNWSVKNRLGVNGALTNLLSLRVMAGYAVGLYNDSVLDEYEDVVGEVALAYRFRPQHRLEASYVRDVQNSALGGWIRSDRVSAALRLSFFGALSVGLEAGYGYLGYGRMVAPDGVSPLGAGTDGFERSDHRVDGAIRGEYRATNWLAFMADATVESTFTDFEYAAPSASGALGGPARVLPDPAGYLSFQFFGGVRAYY